MLLEFAPMEGITTSAYRRLHHELFPGVDRYYTPFWSPTQDHRLTNRDKRELLPEQNAGMNVVPQLLTKNEADFIWGVQELHAMGYEEVNLNVGCPSGTVTAKGKGSGMLADLERLRQFLDEVFDKSPCAISIKTRLGLREPEEFEQVLELYNRYPIKQLTIHPRVRQDLYRHPVRMEWFEYAVEHSKNPLAFNGGLVTVADYQTCADRYPQMVAIMVGQAMVSDPAYGRKLKGGAGATKEELREFHDRLLDTYAELFESRPNAIKRMKELWFYESRMFEESDQMVKQILKTKKPDEYAVQTAEAFRQLKLLPQSRGGW